MTRTVEVGIEPKPDPKTTEQAVRCDACKAYVTNSQPDCRCS